MGQLRGASPALPMMATSVRDLWRGARDDASDATFSLFLAAGTLLPAVRLC